MAFSAYVNFPSWRGIADVKQTAESDVNSQIYEGVV